MRICAVVCCLVASFLVRGADVDAAAIEGAANKASDYLLKSQNADGTFGKSKAAAMPGLVGVVVEAVATSPKKLREANTPELGKAAKFIVSKQQGSGAIAAPDMGLENYNTSVAVIGLAALENPEYKPVLENAKKYLLTCQNEGADKDDVNKGGFGYGPKQRGDLSNSAFSLEALKAAGLEENSPAWNNAVTFIKRCQDNAETNDVAKMKGGKNSGGFVYLPGESPFGTEAGRGDRGYAPRPYGNMTYEAVKSLIYCGMKKDDPVMQAAFKWIHANYSVKDQPGAVGSEGYFYYVFSMAKACTAAGVKELELADGRKVIWAKELGAHLISLQKADGSFVNADGRWMEGDATLATAYALRALSLCAHAAK